MSMAQAKLMQVYRKLVSLHKKVEVFCKEVEFQDHNFL